eukprot:CAMPEP_0197325140 /NCGR_PEP_ID=MMETSP0891-20130614/71507_1 /TAXON_ID=44058 ORGANISM="Aureoumbra lagunensis, Strain CCMP1510" /NCGR_SAMPLE_ID=MMETSP0891 /ASSEMBLY_ACC=CAM_ASM_000534 /LENGTH=208 /DNA_ID=CAMNT_0042818057 /DNA_START=1533 /DNA_END=2159 /DNA_ORIENTATION=-
MDESTHRRTQARLKPLRMGSLKKKESRLKPIQSSPATALEINQLEAGMSILRTLSQVLIVEDSSMIRRSIMMKLKSVWNRFASIPTLPDLIEFDTVEQLLGETENLNTILPRSDLVITVDQNLDSQGGILRGEDLIKALIQGEFKGIIVSISGDDDTANIHRSLGADIILGKPLPKNEVILHKLEEACAIKNGLDFLPQQASSTDMLL